MSARVCPECGSDTWRAAHYDDLADARDRHQRKNESQALQILRLELRVAELEAREHLRGKKVMRQARVIRRLENRIRSLGVFPHEGATLDNISPVQRVELVEPRLSQRRKMEKAAEEARRTTGEPCSHPEDSLSGVALGDVPAGPNEVPNV